jgi:hypothetical protein
MLYTTPVDWQLPSRYNRAIPSENSIRLYPVNPFVINVNPSCRSE